MVGDGSVASDASAVRGNWPPTETQDLGAWLHILTRSRTNSTTKMPWLPAARGTLAARPCKRNPSGFASRRSFFAVPFLRAIAKYRGIYMLRAHQCLKLWRRTKRGKNPAIRYRSCVAYAWARGYQRGRRGRLAGAQRVRFLRQDPQSSFR